MMRRFEVVMPLSKNSSQSLAEVADYSLSQNYPNPFNPATTIIFSIPDNALVTLRVYNSLGEEVGTLLNQQLPKGKHRVNFNAGNLNSGMYFYTLTSGYFKESRKMLLLK